MRDENPSEKSSREEAAAAPVQPTDDDTTAGLNEEVPDQQNADAGNPSVSPSTNIRESAESIAKSISGKNLNIDTLLKVPVSLSVEVGRTKMTLNDLLAAQEGSIIELERMVDEPLDIRVNGALIAHGVVVLADEKFGLQITDIISLEERARSL